MAESGGFSDMSVVNNRRSRGGHGNRRGGGGGIRRGGNSSVLRNFAAHVRRSVLPVLRNYAALVRRYDHERRRYERGDG